MQVSLIDQIIEQLQIMPHPLQQQVLKFVQGLGQAVLQGTPGTRLLQFAGSISTDDLALMQDAIAQDCERVDLDEW